LKKAEIDVKTIAQQQMKQIRGYASVLASLVAQLDAWLRSAPVAAGIIHARRPVVTGFNNHLTALCVSHGLTKECNKERNESGAMMAFGSRSPISKHSNIIRGVRPQVATG
jgi:hypothetical protein